MRRRSLSLRILAAMLAVVAVGAVTLFVTARLLGPQLFDTEVQRLGQRYGWSERGVSPGGGGPGGGGQGQGGRGSGQAAVIEDDLNDAFTDSLNVALVVAMGAGAVAAVAGALVVSRRVLRPLDRMRGAVRRMAEGSYGDSIPEPGDRELGELAGDVNALGEALAATEELRARLVSDLAHELRTPITAIEGFLEGMEDGVFDPDAGTLAAMKAEARRLHRLAADLSMLSRADEEAFELQREDADLGVIATAAAGGLTAAATAGGVDLLVEEMPALPVRIDIDRLAQVFSNILHNAIRHTPSGGVIRVRGEVVGGTARVVVSDTGEGIPPEDLERVFERFYRVPGATSSSGGSGIGLTIARSFTRAHDGDLAAESRGPGRGASFIVTVPLRV
jgi:histidine kinase